MAGSVTPKNVVNGSYPNTVRSKTNFPIFWQQPTTMRFGEVVPHYAHFQVSNDDDRLNCQTRLDTLPLGSPLLSQVRLHRMYGGVPLSAIYYNTYSKIFVNPKKGDDVDFNSARAGINWGLLSIFLYNQASDRSGSGTQSALMLGAVSALLCMYLADFGSLPARLQLLPYSKQLGNSKERSVYSRFITDFVGDFLDNLGGSITFSMSWTEGDAVIQKNYDTSVVNGVGGLRDFFDDLLYHNVSVTNVSNVGVLKQILTSFVTISGNAGMSPTQWFFNTEVNVESLCAYQLLCAQFMTNSSIDPVYTSELYRQNMQSLLDQSTAVSLQDSYFVWNGIRISYDWCSYQLISKAIEYFTSESVQDEYLPFLGYLCNLLLPVRSLRYGDMMNGCFSQPLAVGDVNAPVDGASLESLTVSAVSMTETILSQRFLNLVNSAPSTIQSYSAAVFGVVPDYLPPEPRMYVHTVDDMNDVVNVNSADDQGTQNSSLSVRSNRNEYQQHWNQETFTIGVVWFDAIQSYAGALSPFALKFDRMDYFIPQLQDIGMQPVRLCYGFGSADPNLIYGYLPNDYEFKQRICFATGAFVDNTLPYWAFIRSAGAADAYSINPTSIRHSPAEFDYFYKSLTGYGVGYFHFILSFVFNLSASRPMEFNPGILMK